MATNLEELELIEINKLRRNIEIIKGLPHLHGQKMYPWQRIIFESRNRLLFCTAANQVGKSSILIKKCIHWATSPDLWPSLWNTTPRQFWYLYPDYGTATREFESKWEPEFLPRGKFKDDPQYGWHAEFEKKEIKAIRFNTGITVYFLAYAQMARMMQASTVHATWCDEEINDTLFPELRFRLMAVGGYFHAAFTATLGQEFWRAIMEDRGPGELFPDALKMQIDLEKDCRFFEDGTPSHWTDEAVREAIAACPTEAEVLRRIRGRFVVTQGRRYPSFSQARNVRPPETEGAPPDWLIFAGVDLGSGSDRGHPSAITFVAVRPDFSFGRVFKHWNGRGVSTTASDVFQKFLEMRGKMRCVHQCYDYSAKDFGTIAQRAGEAFSQAKKDRQLGDNILNSLFRNQMLVIDDIPENYPLIKELERANENDRKTMAHDDSCFIAGTKVATPTGQKNIEDLNVGDFVLTRGGARRIVSKFKKEAETREYRFSNGAMFTATPNHPVWTENRGFIPLQVLTRNDTLLSFSAWQNQKLLFLTALNSEDTQNLLNSHIERLNLLTDRSTGIQVVYNIEVEGQPEYFANDILVHNCDSARYCVAPIAWDWCFLNPELNTPPPEKQILTPEQERRKFALVGKQTEDEDEPFMRGMDEEISFWQNYLDA